MNVIAAKPSPDMLDYLLKRRSVPLKQMGEPGPDDGQIETILKAASRVPDHGKMFPWYFIVFKGEARREAGEMIARAYQQTQPDAAPAKLELEAERFLRAPVVIGVISRIRKGKNPAWEQILSAGAACQNLCLAANALGFGTNWLTEWYAYNNTFRAELGLDPEDHIAGFIHIGTPAAPPEERDRPDIKEIVTDWKPGQKLKKGENYGQPDKGWPVAGFELKLFA